MKQKKLLLALLIALTILSCSKDDGPSTPETKTPTIAGFTPTSGPVGTQFVITGTNFSTTASQNAVKIGTVSATVTAATATKITTSVPTGATTGKVSVTVGGKTATSASNFTVTVPTANNAVPVITTTGFEVAESLKAGGAVGTVSATDDDKADVLIYGITDASGLFVINPSSGAITLATGASLDFETKTAYPVVLSVTDGKDTATKNINITVTDVNEPVTITADQAFSAGEDIADDVEIGTVQANDPEGELTYSITADASGLFEIDEAAGALSLIAGKSLDYETAMEHTITVQVTDGVNEVSTDVTITVTNVIESLQEDPASFITTWTTEIDNDILTIGIRIGFTYDFTIDWGDGTAEEHITDGSQNPTHQYATLGVHTVAIKGTKFPAFRMSSVGQADKLKLSSIEQWGTNPWNTMSETFYGCRNLKYNATDNPDLTQVTDMSSMFFNVDGFDNNGSEDFNGWDVSNVQLMEHLFEESNFNGNISAWEVGNVTSMSAMFFSATEFTGNLAPWGPKLGKVTNMSGMFAATIFNSDISGWDVSSVTDMTSMFQQGLFDQSLANWDVSNVSSMVNMFSGAPNFNQNLGAWDLSSVTDMTGMLDNSALDTDNYDAILFGWYNGANTPNNITLGAAGVSFCSITANAARGYLIDPNDKNWTINDAGQNCN